MHLEMMDNLAHSMAQENGKNVFKGCLLVSALVEQYKERFKSRVKATQFCQELVDGGHIESIMGTKKFWDSVNLYRWKEHSIMHDARKLVLNSGYIPKHKLIKLVEMQQQRFKKKSQYHQRNTSSSSEESNSFEEKADSKIFNRKPRIERRQTVSVYSPENLRAVTHKVHNTFHQSGSLSDLNRMSSMSIETLARMGHSQSERSLQSAVTSTSGGSVNGRGSPRDFQDDRRSTPSPLRHLVSASPGGNSQNGKLSRTTSLGTEFRGPKDRRGIYYYDGADFPAVDFTDIDFVPARPASTTNLHTNATDTYKTTASMNQHGRLTIGERSRRGFGVGKAGNYTQTMPRHPNVSGLAHKWGSVDNIVAGNINFKNNRNVNRALRSMGEPDWGSIESVASDPQFRSNFPKPGSPKIHENAKSAVQTTDDKYSFTGSHENVADQSYSDNEKQLLENMKHMKIKHDAVVRAYETKVNELMSKMHELRGIADMLEHAGKVPSRSASPPSDSTSSSNKDSPGNKENRPVVAPPPPAPPAPPPLTVGCVPRADRPTKPAVKPRIKMRPLFWNRILITNSNDVDTIWHELTESKFDIDEIERLFGKKVEPEKSNTLHDTLNRNSGKSRSQPAKILDTNRSRSVAIRLRSLHCDMNDIKRAVHDINFSKLDIESLQGIYDIRGTKEEISSIEQYILHHENVVLDQPEQFLLELSKMSHFAERVECLMLKKKFNESMFNIDQQMSIVNTGCKELRNNVGLKKLLQLTLAFGNYMNGGTQRGQADGFKLTILTKLKDVKGMDANLNLHHYLIRVYIKEHEENAGSNEATFQLPDPAIMQRAAQVSFKEIEADLAVMERQIKIHKVKVQNVIRECTSNLVQPFKQHMEDFFESAESMLQRQEQHFATTKDEYTMLMKFFTVATSEEKDKPDVFFTYWSKFLEDSRHFWKLEQVRTAKEKFEAVERKRKERMRMMRRRASVQDLTKPNLKDRFEQLQRQSSLQPGALSRSMSVNSLDKAGEEMPPVIMVQNRNHLTRGHGHQVLNTRENGMPYHAKEAKFGESIRERMHRLALEQEDVVKNEINTLKGSLKDKMRRRTTTNIYEDEEANFNNNGNTGTSNTHFNSCSNNSHQMALRTIHDPNVPEERPPSTLRRSQSLRQRFPEMDKTINRLRMGESLTDLTNGVSSNFI